MLSRDSEDKNYLAMLAIPVILSMLIGFSGDARASEILEAGDSESRIEESSAQRSEKTNPTSSEYSTQEVVVDDDVNRWRKELEKAVVNGDYEKFLILSDNTPFAEIMTQTAFNELIIQYKLHKSGHKISPYFID